MNAFDHLVFDLDDTLLDTSGLLIPHAARESCIKMIEAGLRASVDECLLAREEIAQTSARGHLFAALVNRFGIKAKSPVVEDPSEVAQIGFNAFYNRKVESDIVLFPGLRDSLHDLRGKYGLHLVTAGHPDTQEEKLQILNARELFDSVTIVNTFTGETKGDAFRTLNQHTGHRPERHLSIGNRLDTDIAPAKQIGWKTCWVKYGEYAQSVPTTSFEHPDFTIASIKELISTCRL